MQGSNYALMALLVLLALFLISVGLIFWFAWSSGSGVAGAMVATAAMSSVAAIFAAVVKGPLSDVFGSLNNGEAPRRGIGSLPASPTVCAVPQLPDTGDGSTGLNQRPNCFNTAIAGLGVASSACVAIRLVKRMLPTPIGRPLQRPRWETDAIFQNVS